MDAWRSGDVLEVPMGESSIETCRSFRESGSRPAMPRMAATVMLVRESTGVDPHGAGSHEVAQSGPSCDSAGLPLDAGGPSEALRREAFMLRRVKSMAFVPDAVVFPGGSVDPRDADERLPWAGPSPEAWAARMGIDEDEARRVVVAAAREVFEECGVLLAGENGGDVVSDVARATWREERRRLAEHESSFAEVLVRHGLVLRADLLGLRSHWLTPEYEPRRYDTFFFAALVPAGQTPDDRTSETNRAEWADARRILEGGRRGKVRIVPPTAYNLAHLVNAPSIEAFVAGVPAVERIMLEPARNEAGEAVLRCLLP